MSDQEHKGELAEATTGVVPMVPGPELSPLQIIQTAVANGVSMSDLEGLVGLQRQMNADAAKIAFVRAMAEFKRNPPQIIKDVQVSFGQGNSKTEYKHADIAKASEKIGVALLDHGLTHRWKTENADNGMARVTCIITHVDGHSEESSMQAAPDQSGGKNPIQAAGSTVSYLQRYTLLTAVGIVAQGVDNDGRGAVTEDAIALVTPEQITAIEDLIEKHEIDRHLVLDWAKIESFKDVRADQFDKFMGKLKARAEAQK